MNTVSFKMNGRSLLQDVPDYVETISQFKNNILRDFPKYKYQNLIVCYIKQGHHIVSSDEDFINFNRIYYVIIKPIVCNDHSYFHSTSDFNNNNSMTINFDDSEDDSDAEDDSGSEDDSDAEDESGSEDESDYESDNNVSELD